MGSGVDLTRFSPAPLPSGVPVFLLVARLLGDKGIREFVAAARYLRGRYPIARCALLGPFDENPTAISRDELDEWVREDVVEYWGQTDDVRPFLAACTVFVMPSYREGMPRSVLEAMAMGRPIISTDVPGCRDTVEPGLNGWLVPARDATALANAMVHCIENLDLLVSMGLESRRLAEKNFDVHAINAIILKRLAL
jgi:glycosyltransferase involved in cell wall biosynthesis